MKVSRSLPICGVFLLLASRVVSGADPRTIADAATASLITGQAAVSNLVVGVVAAEQSYVFRYGDAAGPGVDSFRDFQIASVTKPFTGLLLARMVAEGKVAYAEAVAACAGNATTSTCFKGVPITFLHLVTHYSGLPLTPTDQKNGRYTPADFERFLAGYKLTRAPGSRFEYSTTGFALLGRTLAERAHATSFEELLAAEVLTPLELKQTQFSRPYDNYAAPSGGLVSTVDDLLRFLSLNLEPAKAGSLASAIRLTQVSDPALPSIPPSIAARGWHVIQPLGYHWHSGVTATSRAFVAFDLKTKVGVVLLTKSAIAPTDSRLELAGFSILGGLAAGR